MPKGADMTLLEIFRIVRAHRSQTQIANAFRDCFGIRCDDEVTYKALEILESDYESFLERQEVREAMMQRYGALDRP